MILCNIIPIVYTVQPSTHWFRTWDSAVLLIKVVSESLFAKLESVTLNQSSVTLATREGHLKNKIQNVYVETTDKKEVLLNLNSGEEPSLTPSNRSAAKKFAFRTRTISNLFSSGPGKRFRGKKGPRPGLAIKRAGMSQVTKTLVILKLGKVASKRFEPIAQRIHSLFWKMDKSFQIFRRRFGAGLAAKAAVAVDDSRLLQRSSPSPHLDSVRTPFSQRHWQSFLLGGSKKTNLVVAGFHRPWPLKFSGLNGEADLQSQTPYPTRISVLSSSPTSVAAGSENVAILCPVMTVTLTSCAQDSQKKQVLQHDVNLKQTCLQKLLRICSKNQSSLQR